MAKKKSASKSLDYSKNYMENQSVRSVSLVFAGMLALLFFGLGLALGTML